jgi:site-specific recombinase XerD
MPSDMKRKMFEAIGSKNALINKKLAQIAKLAGIEKRISFHISRHSFAKAAKEKGLDNLEVKELLAHTNIATTQKYMGSFETKRTDEAMRKVFQNDAETELLNQLKDVNPELLKSVLAELSKR